MPTKKQMATASKHIADVIGRNYIEGNGDMCSCWFQPEGGGPVGMTLFQGVPVGTPEPFTDVPYRGKLELLLTFVDWKGFSHSQESDVIHRVIDGKSPDIWMDGIQAEGPTVSTVKARLEKALFGDKRTEVKQDSKTHEKTNEKGGIER